MYANQPEVKQYVDMDDALARVRGNKKLYKRMLMLFLDNKEVASLKESLEAGNLEQAATDAHTIKGMTGNLSLTKVFTLSMELMEQLRGGTYDKEVAEAFFQAYDATREHVEKIIAEIDAEG